jgi:hypothetical protein
MAHRWAEAVACVKDIMKHRNKWESDKEFRLRHAALGGIFDVFAPGSVQDDKGEALCWIPDTMHQTPPTTPRLTIGAAKKKSLVELFNNSSIYCKVMLKEEVSDELKDITLEASGLDWLSDKAFEIIETGERDLMRKNSKPQKA